MAITLTEKAAKHVSRYIDKRGKGIGLRFGVRTTGCSGLAYKLEYVDDSETKIRSLNLTGSRYLSILKVCRTLTVPNSILRARV
jgi:Fe-S cluster assembly iron-binding protein IscA